MVIIHDEMSKILLFLKKCYILLKKYPNSINNRCHIYIYQIYFKTFITEILISRTNQYISILLKYFPLTMKRSVYNKNIHLCNI